MSGMPRERGKPRRTGGSCSGLCGHGHSDYRSLGSGCDCSFHFVMDHGTPLPVTATEDTKPTLSPPSSSIQLSLFPTLPMPLAPKFHHLPLLDSRLFSMTSFWHYTETMMNKILGKN
jgi:hypothetical protein